ncbi:Uncharacterized conserved protein YgbK, DUF1537 family [Roseovarius azorensis]|uniref:Uncharacterized conserved protein YgbK, DUF1537 family n=1 Tax=Roseovarius azorensis TaxID=1287727 RepID=A0A1H7QH16_9RHOB|nr:four-carbon acid sugar kinase family protein [Roseovarius azorensis]SEL46587.1 Uncharacterized conserved protein YgbK, DUF1537 family [Roseovarius azorensis]
MTNDLLIAYYGDDFTGSTDVMESLSMNGVQTVLFLDLPTAEQLARFPSARAVGIAGMSRAMSPGWMSKNLPPVYDALKALGAPVCHYKVCSTFDSSPETGSIGRAIEIGRECFGTPTVPVVVGAPALRRYQVFGNLFASVSDATFRIDRHPTMSRHPVTPMTEGDLRCHLAAQTDLDVELMDILALWDDSYRERHADVMRRDPDILFYDVMDQRSLRRSGELIWNAAGGRSLFCAGSSGLEYALVAHWRAQGLVPAAEDLPAPGFDPVERMFVISGSCSPVTGGQIGAALNAGYLGCTIDPANILNPDTRSDVIETVTNACVAGLAEGRNVVAYSAIGAPDAKARALYERNPEAFTRELSQAQGTIFRDTLHRSGLTRAVVAGGDTSGGITGGLGLFALTALAPITPGAPLCRAHAENPKFDGLEIVLKGGQMGDKDFFEHVRKGTK